MKKSILVILSFFALSVLQVSFLPHFTVAGWTINVVVVALVVLASFASPRTGVEGAAIGGFFLDVYSSLPFGFWILLSLALFFSARYILQNYVRLPQYI